MANNNIGAKIFSQSFNSKDIEATYNKIVSVISKETGKAEDEIKKEIDNLNFGEDLQKKIIEEFEKAEKKIGGKSFSFSKDLFKGLFDSKGSEEEINKVVKIFQSKINSMIEIKNRINDDKIFVQIDDSQMDNLITKMRSILELREKLENQKSAGERTSGTTKSLKTREKNLDTEMESLKSSLASISGVGSGSGNNKALEAINQKIKEIEESLKKAKEEAEQFNTTLKYVEKAYNKYKNKDSDENALNFQKTFQNYIKSGGDKSKLNKDILEYYDFSKLSVPDSFIPFKEIKIDTEQLEKTEQKVKDLEASLEELYKKRDSLSKGGIGDGFSATNEDVQNLINSIRELIEEIRKLTQVKVSEDIFSQENVDEIASKFNSIASNFGDDLVASVDDFIESLNRVDQREFSFDNIKNSLLDIVTEFKNSLAQVGLTNTQLDESYKMIKGWNDADTYSVNRGGLTTTHERGAFLNSKTGDVSNSYFIDAEKSFGVQLFNAVERLSVGLSGEISDVYDTFVHSHPFRKMVDNLTAKGSDIGFSFSDLDVAINKFLKERINNMMVTNNYKYANLDLSGIEKTIAKELLTHFRSELVKSGLQWDENDNLFFPKDLATDGNIFDLDKKSEIINNALRQALKNVGLDESRLTIGNIEDLKTDLTQLGNESTEAKEAFQSLLNILREISSALTDINNNGFKLSAGKVESDQSKLQSELDETKQKLESLSKEAEETKKQLDNIKNADVGINSKGSGEQPSSIPDTPEEQKDLVSEQQTLKSLQEAIDKVKSAINEKTEAIESEETQMKTSVDAEIAKLQELESKLTEIKTQFQNGILSKNPDGGDNVTLEKDVNLKPTLDADKFKKDAEGLLAHANVEKEVTLKVGDLDLNSAQGVSGEQSVTDNITNDNVIEEQNKDLKEQQRLYNNIIKLLAECVSLQDKINAGNRYIVDGNLINSSDIRKQTGKVSQRSVKYQLDNYLRAAKNEYGIYSDNSIKQAKEQLAAYVADLDNAEKTAEIFGNKNKELFNEVSQMIENARVSLDAYNELQRNLYVSDGQLSELNRLQTGENLKMGELWKLEDIVRTDDLDSALKYITDELGIKIPQAAEKTKAALDEVGSSVKDVQDGEKSKGNLLSIQPQPEINENEWIEKINNIIRTINKRSDLAKVQIQPDTSSNEWNEFKTFIKNISEQVIKLNLQMNEDGSVTKKKSITLPSDLNKSYQNSTKYANELYKIKEQIAKATESNNKKELEKLATLKAQEKEFENLLKLEKDFRASDRFSDFDTSSKDDALNKLITDKQQEYQANRNVAASYLVSRMASIEDEAWKANEAYDQNKKLEEVNRLLDLQREKWQEINNIRIKMESESGFDDDQIDLDILEQQKKALMEEVELIQEQLKQYDSLIDKKKESKKLDAITTDANKTINGGRVVDLDQAYNEANKINEALIKTENMMNRFMNGVNRNDSLFGEAFENAKNDISEFNRQLESGEITLSQYNKFVNDLKKNLSIQKDTVAIVDPEDISNIEQIRDVLKRYMDEATNGTAENLKWNDSARTLTGTFKNQNGEIQNVTTAIKDLNNGTSAVTTSFGKAQKPISNWSKLIDELGVKFRNLATYLASFVGFYEIWGAIKQGVTYVRELDTALTEMRKVSDETITSLREFQEASFDVADSIGATAKEISNSTADFMRLGYSLDEAASLAEDANIYANVGDMEIDEATEHMISSIKAWGSEFSSEVEASEAIIDRYNEIGNNFAISSADIGSAMERSGAALKAAGNDLNESLGLIVSGNLIQQDADVTAAALRTMSLRIRGASSELEDLGEETDDMATSTAKLREEIKALSGVDIMLDDETFKSTAEIIKELGAVWEDLSDITQANILEQIAGKNRASTVAGLLENYELIDEVIETAENATGSAAKENEAYLESIDGKLDQLTNKVQEFWDTFIDTDIVKAVIDFLTNLINLATDFVDTIGAFPILMTTVVAAISKFSGAKLFTGGGRAKYL